MAEQYSIIYIYIDINIYLYIYHIFFIHLSVDGHLVCFHILAIVNKATMNTGVHVSFQTSVSVFFVYIPRSGIAGSYGSFFFVIFIQCLEVTFYLQLLQNIVQYILEPILHPILCTSHFPTPIQPLSTPLVTTCLFSIPVCFFLLYSLVCCNFQIPYM